MFHGILHSLFLQIFEWWTHGIKRSSRARISHLVLTVKGGHFGQNDQNCRKITNSAFFGKTIRGTGKDKPIFGVVQGFPQFSTLGEILSSPPQWARSPKETHCNGQNSGWKFRPYFRPLLGTPIYCPELWNKYFHEKWL